MKKGKIFLIFAFSSLILSGCSAVRAHYSYAVTSSTPTNTQSTGNQTPEEEAPEEQPVEESHTHSFEGEYGSNANEHWRFCECGEQEIAPHNFVLVSSTEMTCSEASVNTYRCSVCGYQKFVADHELAEHVYSSRITKEATCTEAGEVTFHCDKCGEEYKVDLPINANAHHFVQKGDVHDGITDFECENANCEVTKMVVDHSEKQTAQVEASTLKEAGEVQLKEAAIAFDDDTLNSIEAENVTIGAEATPIADLKNESGEAMALEESVAEKLADTTIIDFSMKNGEEKVSEFSGKVKVTIPYELKANESADGITIWYLNEGEPEPIQAEYGNHSVSFETNHFSYYAVVHLEPEEVCAHFGHELVKGPYQESTCAVHGYDDTICRRCGASSRTDLALKPHSYECIEAIDPTTSSAGKLTYECSVCHDKYEQEVPALNPKSEKGFWMNFIQSLITSELYIHTETSENDNVRVSDQYSGKDFEGESFSYTSSMSNNYKSESGTYKGYRYYDDFSRYQYYNNSAPAEQYAKLLDHAPAVIKEDIESIGEWFTNKFFTKKEIVEGYEYNINVNAVVALGEDFMNESPDVMLTNLFGESFWGEVKDFIAQNYDGTIGDLITNLGLKGYVAKEFYDAFVSMAREIDQNVNIPKYDDIFTEELKGTKVIDFIIENLRNPRIDNPGEHKYPVPTEIPTTYEEAKVFIDAYLNATSTLDIIYSFEKEASSSSDRIPSYEDFKAQLESTMNAMKNLVKGTLKTDKNGGFISVSYAVDEFDATELAVVAENDPSLESQRLSASVYIKKSFDKHEVLRKVKAMAEKCEIREHIFDLDASHYQWFAQAYEDYYEKDYPGIKFEYKRNYNNEYYDALVSNKKIRAVTDDTRGDIAEEDEFEEGYLIIRLYNESYYNYHGSFYTNTYGLGTKFAKNERVLVLGKGNFVASVHLLTNISDNIRSETSVYDIPRFDFAYSFNKNQMYSTSGSFSYLGSSPVVREVITKEEFLANRNYYDPSYFDDPERTFIFVKNTYLLDGRTSYSYDYFFNGEIPSYYLSYQTSIITRDMNDEALENSYRFALTRYIGSKDYKLYLKDLSLRYAWRSEYSDVSYVGKIYFGSSSSYNDFSKTFTFGNLKVEFARSSGNLECAKTETWKLSVGSTRLYNGSKSYHAFLNSKIHSEYFNEWVDETECTKLCGLLETCELCGEVSYDGRYHDDSYHSYGDPVEIDRKQREGGTECEFEVKYREVCEKCGNVHEYTRYEDTHDWVETSQTVQIDSCLSRTDYERNCSVCGKHTEDHYFSVEHTGQRQHVEIDVPATETKPGYWVDYYECSDCHHPYYWYDDVNYGLYHVCCHENGSVNEDTLVFYCPDCGYTVNTNGSRPEIIFEDLTEEGSDVLTFGVFIPSLAQRNGGWMEARYLYEYYTTRVACGYFDESGNFVLVEASIDEVTPGFDFVETPWSDRWGRHYNYYPFYRDFGYATVSFSANAYDDLLASAQAKQPDKDLKLAIAVASRDSEEGSATVHYYVFTD